MGWGEGGDGGREGGRGMGWEEVGGRGGGVVVAAQRAPRVWLERL